MAFVRLSDKAANRTRLELADIFANHANRFLSNYRVGFRHLKVLYAVVNCRTATLGGHRFKCASCDYQRYVYHSCRNRHCPKCQTRCKETWRKARSLELLPVPYFHQVFTLPHELNPWLLASESNQRKLLELLFKATADTLLEFGRGELGGQVGFTLILHTWDQQLRPHFHLHCLIASGSLSRTENRWRAGGNNFLFPVRALSKMFRGKFVSGLNQLFDNGELDEPRGVAQLHVKQLLRSLSRKPWVVYSKAPFAGPRKLLDYLSRYTHRVAISNDRLLRLQNGQVSFTYRDRKDGDRRKALTLDASQFIGRFLSHVLPDGFTRIRHYGFMANRHRRERLRQIRGLLGATAPVPASPAETLAQWLAATLGIEINNCPCCGSKLVKFELKPTAPRRTIGPCLLSRGPPRVPTK